MRPATMLARSTAMVVFAFSKRSMDSMMKMEAESGAENAAASPAPAPAAIIWFLSAAFVPVVLLAMSPM